MQLYVLIYSLTGTHRVVVEASDQPPSSYARNGEGSLREGHKSMIQATNQTSPHRYRSVPFPTGHPPKDADISLLDLDSPLENATHMQQRPSHLELSSYAVDNQYETCLQGLSLDDAEEVPEIFQIEPATRDGAYSGGSEHDFLAVALGLPTPLESGTTRTLVESQSVAGRVRGLGRYSFHLFSIFSANDFILEALMMAKGRKLNSKKSEGIAPFEVISPEHIPEVLEDIHAFYNWDGQGNSITGPCLSAIAEVHSPRESGGFIQPSAAQTSPYY